MQTNLHGNLPHFLPLNPISKKGSSFNGGFHFLPNDARYRRPDISSGKKRRRNGSQRLVKLVLQSLPVIASKLKILPQPLDMIAGELCSGDGNGNGGGWGFPGSSGDGWFDGWRRRGMRRKQGFWWVFVVFGLGLVLGRETGSDMMYVVWGFGLISFALVEIWSRKAVRDGMMFGLCCLGVSAVFGLRGEAKNRLRDFLPLMKMKSFRLGRRKSRRAL